MAGLRITGGKWRGRRVGSDAEIRPTSEKVREALFSIWGGRVEACRFLDLFSGTGVVGLEAASRGAASVVFVDSEARLLRLVERNCRALAFKPRALSRATLPREMKALERSTAGGFDLIFADPPYRFPAYPELIRDTANLLAEAGELTVEHSARVTLPDTQPNLVRLAVRHYGETALSFFRRRETPAH